MRSASRAVLIRSSRGNGGTTPPASSRERAGWVMPAQLASSCLGQPQGQAAFAYCLADEVCAAGLGVPFAVLCAAAGAARRGSHRRECCALMSGHLPVEHFVSWPVFGFTDLLCLQRRGATSAVWAWRVLLNTVSKITRRRGASQVGDPGLLA